MTEPWALVDDVAKQLGLKHAVYGWIDHRGLPAKIGRLWKLADAGVDQSAGTGRPDTRDKPTGRGAA